MEEVLDDDDEVKVEKSSVEKMEKHKDPESRVLEPQPPGRHSLQSLCLLAGSSSFLHPTMHHKWNVKYLILTVSISLPVSKLI